MRPAATAIILGTVIFGGAAFSAGTPDTDYEKLIQAATFSLSEAIDRALAVPESKGCTVVNAELEEEDGKILYSIELAKGDRILEINFDVTNGSRLPLENEGHDKSAQAKAAKLTVKEAIALATQPGIQPIEASLLMKDGKPEVQVKVFTPTRKLKIVVIDALTGEILKSEKTPAGAEPKDEKEK